jgi:P27 family predicted phage terminase small subunit
MGRRGPKPQPAAVKEAKGNPGHRPIGADVAADAPAAAASKVAPPSWLKGKGLEVWNRIAPRLVAQRLLSQIDAETFARYCRNFARWHKMQAMLDGSGKSEFYESESAHGKLWRIHPAFSIAERLERNLLAAEDRFGLNPAERQRIFAARAAGGASGDLFNPRPAPDREPASPDSTADQSRAKSAVGLLN